MSPQTPKQKYLATFALVGVVFLALASICQAQDYDDEGYGSQGGQGGNQGDNENYQNNYDDGYSGNMPSYQQNVDSDSSNNNPASYSTQGGSDADGDYEGDDGSAAAAASELAPSSIRVKRSTGGSSEAASEQVVAASEPKLRVKRHGKYYIGPVYTYVKTDKHANFKWGVSRI